MIRISTIIFILLTTLTTLRAETNEIISQGNYDSVVLSRYMDDYNTSLTESVTPKSSWRDPYTFHIKQLITPAALIIIGSSSLYIDAVSSADEYLFDKIYSPREAHSFDDYLQYAPYATLWILDACGVKSLNRFKEQTTNVALSMAFMGILVNASKYTINRQRPNENSFNSMPSGHTAMAFTGAEILRQEFRDTTPWIGIAGYTMATTVAFMRLWNGRHYTTDVLVGAGVGILSVRAAYWLAPCVNRLLWGSDLREDNGGFKGSITPYSDGDSTGVAMMVTF